MRIRTIWQLIKATLTEWTFQEVSMLASSLAYFTIFSLAPLLMIIIILLGTIFGKDAAQQEIVERLQSFMGDQAANTIATMIENAQAPDSDQNPFAILINVVLLAFGASSIFMYMQRALNRIWKIKPQPGRSVLHFVQKRLLSFAMILVIAFLLLTSFVLNIFLAYIIDWVGDNIPGLNYILPLVDFSLSLLAISVLFALIYQILPDAQVRFRDAYTGGLLTALLFIVGQFIFAFFLSNTDIGSAYGVAGSLVIVLVWVYYSSHIVLFGGEFTQVYARRHGEPIIPAEYATHVSTYYDKTEEEEEEDHLITSILHRCRDLWGRLKRQRRR